MSKFNQRKQKVDNQYNAENINIYAQPALKKNEKTFPAQEAYFVNCAWCSHIIETACPLVNTTPKQVYSAIGTPRGVDDFHTYMGCPKCKKMFLVFWVK